MMVKISCLKIAYLGHNGKNKLLKNCLFGYRTPDKSSVMILLIRARSLKFEERALRWSINNNGQTNFVLLVHCCMVCYNMS